MNAQGYYELRRKSTVVGSAAHIVTARGGHATLGSDTESHWLQIFSLIISSDKESQKQTEMRDKYRQRKKNDIF